MASKVRILATGDFHSDISLAMRQAQRAVDESVDIIILNGDIVEENHTEGIVGQFAATQKKVLLVPGNHESLATTNFLAEFYGGINLHGYACLHGDIGFFGCGGAQVGLTPVSEEEIYATLKAGFEKIKHAPKKVMVTHVHPAGTLMEKFSHFVQGSTGLRKAIETFKPDIVICGHVHEAEGIEEMIGTSVVMNVGKKGKIIEI